MKALILAIVLASLAGAQSDLRNSFTFSGGYGRDMNSSCCQTDTAVSLGATYGYRLFRGLQVEGGVMTALSPSPRIVGAFYNYDPGDRFTWLTFGLRGILPLRRDRVELSAAAGGLYEIYSVSNSGPLGPSPRRGWGGYFSGGTAIAIDPGRHFWLGVSPRWYLANPQYARDRWFVVAGDLSFRF